jgi:hypothetical protein
VDSRGNIYPMNEESKALVESMGDILTEIPQEELETVTKMNRVQRRVWVKKFRRRGRGYTK